MKPLLELRQVSKVYGGGVFRRSDVTVALDNLSFTIPDDRPTITAIAGESGSGKTTLAMMLLGFAEPSQGQVFYRGKDVAEMSAAERFLFRREVQPVFQDPYEAFNPFYRVDHVLAAPVRRFNLAPAGEKTRRLIEESLEMVGLRPTETLGRFPHHLSGGQRQRLMVARALLCRPRIIIADEPVSMVDASLRATILASLQTLRQTLGISIIYITHDLTTAYQISDNIVVLYQGQVSETGSVEEVIRKPKHPYTRLLISSIPLPDRKHRWGADASGETEGSAGRVSAGCRFAPRCPVAMEICWKERPALYQADPNRAAACFLYRESPALQSADVAEVFVDGASAGAASNAG